MKGKKKSAPQADGVCPVCGGELEFEGTHDIVDCSTRVHWTCPACRRQGAQWHDIVFAGYKGLARADGTPLAEEDEENLRSEEGCCPVCSGDLEYHGDQEIEENTTEVSWHCEACGVKGIEVNNLVFSEHLDYGAGIDGGLTAIQDIAYERYKLDWMMRSGYSLSDVVRSLAKLISSMESDDDAREVDLLSVFEDWEAEIGFGGEIYACPDEFLDAEYLDKKYMRSLLTKEDYQTYLADVRALMD